MSDVRFPTATPPDDVDVGLSAAIELAGRGVDVAVVFTGDRAVERAFADAATDRGLPFTVVHLVDDAVRGLYGADTVLVRSDQHVAWRGGPLPAGGAGAVLDRVLGHPTSTTEGIRHELTAAV